MKRLSTILFFLLCLGLNAGAQMLTLKVVEPEMRERGLFVAGMKFEQMTFDKNGRYTYDGNLITQKEQVYISLGQTGIFTILEPGKKLEMTVSGKGKYTKVKFKGENAYEAELLYARESFLPTKDAFYEEGNPIDTVSYPEAWRLLDEKYADICRLLKKEKDAGKRQKMQEATVLRYLSNRIQMQKGFCFKRGIDERHDATYAELMAQVDPNDYKFAERSMITEYIYYKMPVKVDTHTNVNDYACGFLNTVCAEITNPEIRYNMLESHVSQCVQAEDLDLDRFWALVKEKCDAEIVSTYQYIVDAKKSTQSGMKCPDVTFSDINGQSHALSEFFGRVLYIDLWATWCGPCCMEIPYLEKLVEHYKGDDRILFLSISSDRDHKAWEEKILEDKPEWPQFITSREEDKLLSSQWGVSSIPRFLIINADGTICSNDAFRPSNENAIERLDAILEENSRLFPSPNAGVTPKRISIFSDHIEAVASQRNITLKEAARQIREIGYTGADVYVTIDKEKLQALDEAGLEHSCCIAVIDFAHGDKEREAQQAIDFMKENGYSQVLLVPGFIPEKERDNLPKLLERIKRFTERANAEGFDVMVEDYDSPESPCYNTQALDRIFKASPMTNHVFDTGNYVFCREDVMETLEHFLDRVHHVHMKDRQSSTDMRTTAIGNGVVPTRQFIARLLAAGYKGWFTAEFFGAPDMYQWAKESYGNIAAAYDNQ